MFEHRLDCPIAVASPDNDGVDAAIRWCLDLLGADETLTIWTPLKSNLAHNDQLSGLSHRSNVCHVTGHGSWHVSDTGPLMMAWPDLEGLGEANRQGGRVTALCVVSSEDDLADWVAMVRPTILGDGSAWEPQLYELDSLLVEELTHLTGSINHNNTIAAGDEKDLVVGVLGAVHDAEIPMSPRTVQSWAVANGWSGNNASQLARYISAFNAGSRPRAHQVYAAGYARDLKKRAAAQRTRRSGS